MGDFKTTIQLIAAFTYITAAAATTCLFEGLSYVLIRPFSLAHHRKICVEFTYAFFLISTFVLERWSKVTFKAYGDIVPKNKSSFIILNHSSSVDFLIGLAYLAKLGHPHPGNTKSAVKSVLATVPLFGTVLFFSEFLFLSRSWSSDKTSFTSKLLSLRQYEQDACPFTIVLFPEGTRLTKQRQEKSTEFIQSLGEPPLNHLLYPRFKAFVTTMQTLGNQIDGVIDATLIFENDHPSLKHTLSGKSNTIIHAHTKYHSTKSLPRDEKGLEKWLRDCWYDKEKRISEYHKDPKSIGPVANDKVFSVEHPSLAPLNGLVVFSLFMGSASLFIASKFPHGIYTIVFVFAWSIIFTGILTMLSNRPSDQGSTKSR